MCRAGKGLRMTDAEWVLFLAVFVLLPMVTFTVGEWRRRRTYRAIREGRWKP